MGVLRDPSGFQTSYPEVKWGGQPPCQRRGKDLAGARQRTANEHPPDQGFAFLFDLSRNVTRDCNAKESHNVTCEGNALVTHSYIFERLRKNFLKDLEKFFQRLREKT